MRTLPFLCACAALLGAAQNQVRPQVHITPLLELDRDASNASLSPDGKTLAFDWCKPDSSCGIYTRPSTGGPATLLVRAGDRDGFPTIPRWSPSGNMVAFM